MVGPTVHLDLPGDDYTLLHAHLQPQATLSQVGTATYPSHYGHPAIWKVLDCTQASPGVTCKYMRPAIS